MIGEILSELWRYRFRYVALLCIVAMLGLIVAATWKNPYYSYVTIAFDERAGGAIDPLEQEARMRQIVLQRDYIEQLIAEQNLAPLALDAKAQERAYSQMVASTSVSALQGRLLVISHRNPDPDVAFRVASALGDHIVNTLVVTQTQVRRDALSFLDQQVTRYSESLASLERELGALGADPQNFETPEERNQRLRRERAALSDIEERLGAAVRRLDVISGQIDREPVRIALDDGVSIDPMIVEELAQLESLLSVYTDIHPEVVRKRERIRELREGTPEQTPRFEINRVHERLREESVSIAAEIAGLRERRLSTMRRLGALERDASGQQVDAQRFIAAQREYALTRGVYDDLVRQREAALVALDMERTQSAAAVRIQQRARRPKIATGPRFSLLIVLSAFAAGASALGVAFLRTQLSTRVRSAQDLRALGLPVLGTVPSASGSDDSLATVAGALLLLFTASAFGVAIWWRLSSVAA